MWTTWARRENAGVGSQPRSILHHAIYWRWRWGGDTNTGCVRCTVVVCLMVLSLPAERTQHTKKTKQFVTIDLRMPCLHVCAVSNRCEVMNRSDWRQRHLDYYSYDFDMMLLINVIIIHQIRDERNEHAEYESILCHDDGKIFVCNHWVRQSWTVFVDIFRFLFWGYAVKGIEHYWLKRTESMASQHAPANSVHYVWIGLNTEFGLRYQKCNYTLSSI